MRDKRTFDVDPTTRRAFMSHAARTLLGVATLSTLGGTQRVLAQAQGQPEASAKSVIYINLVGGMSHLDTFDTKPGTETQGPVRSIDTSASGVQISQFLPKLAQQMHHVAVINSMNSTQGAHAQGQYYLHTSYFLRGTIQHPDLGAWTSHFLGKRNPLLPSNVKIGGASAGLGAGFLEAQHAALPIGRPDAGLQHSVRPDHVSSQRFVKRIQRLKQMNRAFQAKHNTKQARAYASMYDDAVRLMKSKDLAAFDLTVEPESTRLRFGDHKFGQACLLARRLVEHRVRFVEINHGGWDTHDNNFERVESQAAELDQGLAALLSDLHTAGLLAETMVVVATEFGRTPTIQTDRNGRNHYPQAYSCLLAGGGIRGGLKYGKTDKEGREIVENQVSVPDFNATVAFAMGLPLETKTISPSGRPFTVADDGQPIKALLS